MGSRNSSRDNASGVRDDETGENEPDLPTILAYLLRSGQLRLLQSDDVMDSDSDMTDEDEDLADIIDRPPCSAPKTAADLIADRQKIEESKINHEMVLTNGKYSTKPSTRYSVPKLLQMREAGQCGYNGRFSRGDCNTVSSRYLPNFMAAMARFGHKAFCGTHSEDGSVFVTACQDQLIRLYNTTKGWFDNFKTVVARDVGWSILDTAFSPDGHYIIYSSWSDCIHICNVHGEHNVHDALNLEPEGDRFCAFSVQFSSDSKEIVAGANDGCMYIFDREQNKRTLKIETHEDDVNAVAFADRTSQIIYSGGDDGMVKVWDRRTLSEASPEPVGKLAGHSDGITYIDSKKDNYHLISNSKDQSIKLWDTRKFSSSDCVEAARRAVAQQQWDYRWQTFPQSARRNRSIAGDPSLMTYRGHSVLQTLIRCRFSPEFTTSQQYIYTGCSSGAVVIYDLLTGDIVTKLKNRQRACVRDVSWHPYDFSIVSTSWDGSIGKWEYYNPHPPEGNRSTFQFPHFDGADDDLRAGRRPMIVIDI
uniref:DDB1- and CUL4-associated factor 11-like n=1 Tax=Saccoglossus kowalevskii TaxID=10224 RepID=A0ABM0LVW2_SACKO|nr:PREDICTED: DDB1- and CUL4-associated factor 11-like [Saccoglossus kowalevskii]